MSLKINSYCTSNFTSGRKEPIRYGIIHYVSCRLYSPWKHDPYNPKGILELFEKEGRKHQFSCHDIIFRNGEVVNLVRIEDTAWHCGRSVIAIPDYKTYLNHCSYSVELVGMDGDKFTPAQYDMLAKLAVLRENQIEERGLGKIEQFVGHDWVSGKIAVKLGIRTRSEQKYDPGNMFFWDRFYEKRYYLKLKDKIKANILPEVREGILHKLTTGQCLSLFFKRLRGK